MPKPLLLARPSGLYVRFLVPSDLRAVVGTRFLVRPLHLPAGDVARLVAAHLGLALSQAFDALREGRPVDIDEILRRARSGGRIQELTIKGLELPNGTRIAEAEINTPEDEAMMRRLFGSLPNPGPEVAPDAPVSRPAGSAGLRLGAAIQTHLADLERARLDDKTITDSRHALRILEGVVGGDTPVSAITPEHVREFYDLVSYWPSNGSRRHPYKDLPVREVVALAKANEEPLPAARTLIKHEQRLKVFFGSLIDGKHLSSSPQAGVRGFEAPDEEDTGEPFTDDELKIIFGRAFVPWAEKYPHRWFGVALGLYSGARVAEVGQLLVEDIETVDGVPGFFVRKKSKKKSKQAQPAKKIKNKASRRFVPLAKPVLAAGFLDYVAEVRAAGHERLFPNLPNSTGRGFGRGLSRQFSTYIKQQGITTEGQGFHGFRHTFASKLDEAGVSEAAIAAITGHSRAGGSVLQMHYISRGTLQDRVATLAKFSPPVQLPAYTPGQFTEALAEAPIKLVQRKPKRLAELATKQNQE